MAANALHAQGQQVNPASSSFVQADHDFILNQLWSSIAVGTRAAMTAMNAPSVAQCISTGIQDYVTAAVGQGAVPNTTVNAMIGAAATHMASGATPLGVAQVLTANGVSQPQATTIVQQGASAANTATNYAPSIASLVDQTNGVSTAANQLVGQAVSGGVDTTDVQGAVGALQSAVAAIQQQLTSLQSEADGTSTTVASFQAIFDQHTATEAAITAQLGQITDTLNAMIDYLNSQQSSAPAGSPAAGATTTQPANWGWQAPDYTRGWNQPVAAAAPPAPAATNPATPGIVNGGGLTAGAPGQAGAYVDPNGLTTTSFNPSTPLNPNAPTYDMPGPQAEAGLNGFGMKGLSWADSDDADFSIED
jgi:hypothetical protein